MPLRLMAGGLLLVLLDFRVDGVDVLPDIIGWVLVVVAVRQLGAGDPIASLLRWTATGAGVLSLGDLVRVPVVSVVYDVAVAAVPVLLANYLAIRAARVDDVAAENTWLRFRNVVLALSGAGFALAIFSGSSAAAQLLLVVLVATIAAMVLFIVTLYQHAVRPWARPAIGV